MSLNIHDTHMDNPLAGRTPQKAQGVAVLLLLILLVMSLFPGLLAFGVHVAFAQCPNGVCPNVPGAPPGGGTNLFTDFGTPPGGGDGGGGGGIFQGIFGSLSGLLQNPMLLMLLVMLLSQLFQGGATPQTGPAEEQSFLPPPTGRERFYTGPQSPTAPPAVASPSPTSQSTGGSESSSCVCTQLYQPVCGTDGKTYSNLCFAHCANVPVAHAGSCGP